MLASARPCTRLLGTLADQVPPSCTVAWRVCNTVLSAPTKDRLRLRPTAVLRALLPTAGSLTLPDKARLAARSMALR